MNIEEYFDKCLHELEKNSNGEIGRAKRILTDEPLLSFISESAGIYSLEELAIEYDFGTREEMCDYLSVTTDYTIGMIEWILLKGTELIARGE